MDKLLFYDIECFKYDSLVVFKNRNKEIVAYFWSGETDFDECNGFERVPRVIEGKTLVAYNNYNYDDQILTLMMRGMSQSIIKKNNDIIMSGQKTGIRVDERIDSLDCFQQIDLSRPGLKKIEGNMGQRIKESDVPFDIDRPLTNKERQEVFEYCCADVDALIDVYNLREHSYFESKHRLLEMIDNPKANKWNTTTLAANALLDKPLPKWSSLRVPEEMWNDPDIPKDVWELWNQVKDFGMLEPEKKSITIDMFDNLIQFGFGGLHGARKNKKKFKDVKLLDVASLYPSIIINLEVLGTATNKYAAMKEQRIKVKHTDKTLSDALKLVLNSVYGLLKNQYSLLYNPKASQTVCIYGQIILFKLCKKLAEAGCEIVNINTDGVAFVDNGVDYNTTWKDFEDTYNLTLELDEFDMWIQKDVNNYISTQGDHVKVKGGECSKYDKNKYFSNNNARILDIALVDYLVKGKSVIDTLVEHQDEPMLYQYILQAGRTYKGVFDEDGNKFNNINRIFASKPSYADKKLFKKRLDGGLVNFPDVPDHMKLWDDDVSKIDDFNKWIDLNHYYQIVNKRIKAWEE